MRVLCACEESQAVTIEMRKRGVEAYSCDIQECSGGHPEWHIQGDVIPLLNGRCRFQTMDGVWHEIDGRWDMIIAFPPCTYMTKASACRLYKKSGSIDPERMKKAVEARLFFQQILTADCDRIAIENPTPLKVVCLPEPTQVIEPFWFGEPFSKRTCLWLKSLPLLSPTNICEDHKTWIPSNTSKFSKGGGGGKGIAQKQKMRSATFQGVAKAMAEQWAGGDPDA